MSMNEKLLNLLGEITDTAHDMRSILEECDTPAPTPTIASLMAEHIGAKEYEGIVAEIQKWYYGRLVKASWCCTCLSYFSEMAGVSIQTGKHENVDRMKQYMQERDMLDCTVNYGGGHYKPKPGDVVFMSSKHMYDDCTHVGAVLTVNNDTGHIEVISGNCDDQIKVKKYNYLIHKYIVAFGRIIYDN